MMNVLKYILQWKIKMFYVLYNTYDYPLSLLREKIGSDVLNDDVELMQ